ncbi:helix-turn-helix domain-containing protein [Tenacibaculum sp. TC6]|uniref:helix-turn-helix domain-containing protein n=1 Tax=Tenacibaculum sp. TC6 TaxID=3423223 RepID=UPI003D368883
MKYKYYLIVFFICYPLLVTGQNTKELQYKEIEDLYKNSESDSTKLFYAKKYLVKAKNNNDKVRMADGFKFLALIHYPDSLSLRYADSIITITKGIKHEKYPALAYNIKGAVFYEFGNYKQAIDDYLIGLDYAKKNHNESQYLTLKFNIGLLKNNIGERKEAQNVFKEYLGYFEKDNRTRTKNYTRGLYALADSYTYSNNLDSAEIYTKKGIYHSLKEGYNHYYSYLVFNSGVNSFLKKEYSQALDSLKKASAIFVSDGNEKTRYALSCYYIGRLYSETKEKKKSIYYFKKVDSILKLTLDVTPELIDTYNYLIDNAKKERNEHEQLEYVSSLIKFDSILDSNYKYLKNTITKKHDTPELIDQKDKLISKLNKKQGKLSSQLLFLIIGLIVSLLVILYVVRKNYTNRKRYSDLLSKLETKEQKKVNDIESIDPSTINTNNTGIPEHIVKDILIKLETFEKSNQFTKKKYTLNSLAKELNTNSSYLSKVINATKGIGFAHYLNNLKINFAIDKLSKDERFRSYTIKAIAEDSGFNTAQSFTNAFLKETGIYPSYFIKRMEDDKPQKNK